MNSAASKWVNFCQATVPARKEQHFDHAGERRSPKYPRISRANQLMDVLADAFPEFQEHYAESSSNPLRFVVGPNAMAIATPIIATASIANTAATPRTSTAAMRNELSAALSRLQL